MNLLDPAITHYVVREKSYKLSGGEIFDKDGNKLAIIKRKLLALKAEIRLEELDESPLCFIHKKSFSARPIYDVKTPDGVLIGCAKRPLIAFRGSIDMYNADDKIIYKARGGVSKGKIRIMDPKDKKNVYAEIKRSDGCRDINFKDRYAIHVVDPDVDRLMLLAYAIIIDNVYHDK